MTDIQWLALYLGIGLIFGIIAGGYEKTRSNSWMPVFLGVWFLWLPLVIVFIPLSILEELTDRVAKLFIKMRGPQ